MIVVVLYLAPSHILQRANNQHYVPILDAAVAKQVNDTDIVSASRYRFNFTLLI